MEKGIAAVGGGLSILLLLAICRWSLPVPESAAVIGSMGATAVLLFGVPHGPLSQPWPVVAGHGISALIGVACAKTIPVPVLAAAGAVGLALWAMQQLKCIHPPGGATAFTAVLGGTAIHDLGFEFVLVPVLANALAMVALAVLINRPFPWRRYPATPRSRAETSPPPPSRVEPAVPTHAQVVGAIRSLDAFVDISEEDLLHLTRLLSRAAPPLSESKGGRAPADPADPTRPSVQ